jgi:hypothetical protein
VVGVGEGVGVGDDAGEWVGVGVGESDGEAVAEGDVVGFGVAVGGADVPVAGATNGALGVPADPEHAASSAHAAQASLRNGTMFMAPRRMATSSSFRRH